MSSLGTAQRAALLFVPGVSRSWGDKSLRELADDLAVALDDVSAGPVFTASPAEQLAIGSGNSARSVRHVTIQRTAADGGDVEAELDMFELDYLRNLTAPEENKALWLRALTVIATLVVDARQFLAFTPLRKGKTVRERIQLFLFLLVMALYAAFLGIVIASIVTLALETFQAAQAATQPGSVLPTPTPGATPAPSAVQSATVDAGSGSGFAGRVAQLIGLVVTGLWLLLPPKAKIKEAITNTATDYITVEWYLRSGTGAPRLAGDFAGVVSALVDKNAYSRIDIDAYSMGSVIALNELFPSGEPLSDRHALASTYTLVTVGCPFDFVRLILPNYFKNRRPLAGVPKQWLNVFAPDDILGSNFRNDGQRGQPQQAVLDVVVAGSGQEAEAVPMPVPLNIPYQPGGVPAGGGIFGGFRVHGVYWSDGTGQETCWKVLAPRLYAEHPLLAPASPPPVDGGGQT